MNLQVDPKPQKPYTLNPSSSKTPQRLQYPLMKDYTLNYSRIRNMI